MKKYSVGDGFLLVLYKQIGRYSAWFISCLLLFIPACAPEKKVSDPVKGDVLDSIIAVIIILFILSVIVEKVTQLIRKYSPFIRPYHRLHKTALGRTWRNIRKKQKDGTIIDDKIEREVNSLSFMIGLLLSVIFCVDLFQMFTAEDPSQTLNWSTYRWHFYWEKGFWGYRIPLLLISFCLTGFFLTFGSKFFHDLLDTLFQVKNLKRKMVDTNTFDVESVEQLDEFLNKTNSDIIQMAIDQNRSLFQVPNVASPPMRGKIRQAGRVIDCIDIHLKNSSRGNLPHQVMVSLGTGKVINVVVHAIFDVEVPKAAVNQGKVVTNVASTNVEGTICCKVKKGNNVGLLTCSHVFTGGTSDNFFGEISPAPAKLNKVEDGAFVYAICTDEYDVALLTFSDFTYTITPKKERKPVPSDILHTTVRIVCNEETKKGLVVNDRSLEPIEIEYKGGQLHSLSNLMVLSRVTEQDGETNYAAVTVEGDSGACVYDQDDMPIGMIVAGNNKFSYAIPIVNILSKLNATII